MTKDAIILIDDEEYPVCVEYTVAPRTSEWAEEYNFKDITSEDPKIQKLINKNFWRYVDQVKDQIMWG